MTAVRMLGQVEAPDGQQLDVQAIVQSSARAILFSVHAAPSASESQRWTHIWTATPAMRLRQHEPVPSYADAVRELITPDVWAWAWQQALTDSQHRVACLAEDLRFAELELLAARVHTGGLPALTSQVVMSLIEGWTATANELLETAVLIDQETDHG